MNLFFHHVWRMDWGFGNPNVTAALIVTLLMGVWLFAYINRSWGFWVALAGFIPLEICLVHTMSRGGMLGAAAGLGVLLFLTPRPWPRSRITGVMIALWLSVIAALYLKAELRVSDGFIEQDKSISHRLAIWKKAPEMLADAPHGWGWGKSGDAYMEWYQPLVQREQYGSLVNTHLSKIVELGLPGGTLYLFLWLAAFIICWPDPKTRWRAVLVAILTGFFVAASFTNMAPSIVVWYLPFLALIAGICSRIQLRSFPPLKYWIIALPGSALPVVLLYIIGLLSSPSLMAANSHVVVWNGRESKTWILVNRDVLGKLYGRTFRNAWKDNPAGFHTSVAFTEDLSSLPSSVKTLVVAGPPTTELLAKIRRIDPDQLILLNASIPLEFLKSTDTKHVFADIGEFSTLNSETDRNPLLLVKIIRGAGNFLPDWPAIVLQQIAR